MREQTHGAATPRPASHGACAWVVVLALSVVVLALAADFVSSELQRHARFVSDDAMITARYVRNWAEGLGPVWNAGERVEGYTSFVAVALGALQAALGADPLEALYRANVLGLALLVLSCAYVVWRTSEGPATLLLAVVVASMALCNDPLLLWVDGRLEAPLDAGAIAAAFAAAIGYHLAPGRRSGAVVMGLALGALPSVRPDGLWFTGCGLLLTLPHLRGTPRERSVAAVAVAAAVAPILAHELFRLAYYGDWLPNTVRAKVMGLPSRDLVPSGLAYLAGYLRRPPFLPLFGLVSAVVAWREREFRWPVACLVLALLGYMIIMVRAGGDVMPRYRLLVPLVAPTVVLVALGGAALLRRGPSTASIGVGGALLVAAAYAIALQVPSRPQGPDPAAEGGEIVGRYLDANFPPGTLVALNTAGSTPYVASKLRFIDMLGLNDRSIASRRIARFTARWQTNAGHGKGDARYVLSREPDIIIFGFSRGMIPQASPFLTGQEMAQLPAFPARYRERTVEIPVGGDPFLGRLAAVQRGTFTLRYYEKIGERASGTRPQVTGGGVRRSP